MKRRDFNKNLCLYTAAGLAAPHVFTGESKADTPKKKQPNLLYIFPDQYRIQSLSIWRERQYQNALRGVTDPVATPNLDRLAKQGVLFNQVCSTQPVCSPHRAMLMSGMYSRRNGVEYLNCKKDRFQGLHQHITCFTDVLSNAGYETAYVGKTHWERTEPLFDSSFNYVGTKEAPGGHYANPFDTYIPPGRGRHGNKYWFQNIGDRHKNALSYSSEPSLVANKQDGRPHRHQRFTPRLEADVIVDYLKNTDGQRDTNKPFSMIWSPNPPHNPYTDVDRDCDRAMYEKYYADMPLEEVLNRPNQKVSDKNISEITGRIYFALVSSIDEQVGRVLQALEESGEADNTIVVFTSDHGEMMGSHGRMGKNLIYDESFLVPFMMRYPGVLDHRVEDLMLGTVDIMPTLLGLMGLQDQTPKTVEGFNYAQGITKNDYASQAKPKSALYISANRDKGLRTDQYTYYVPTKEAPYVFDNAADPYQLNPLPVDQIPSQDKAFLQQELGNWLATSQDHWFDDRTRQDAITYPG